MERDDRGSGSSGGDGGEDRGGANPSAATIPSGRVEAVRAQWSVHEDGALAYHLQNEEISGKANFNRNQRQTVRDGTRCGFVGYWWARLWGGGVYCLVSTRRFSERIIVGKKF